MVMAVAAVAVAVVVVVIVWLSSSSSSSSSSEMMIRLLIVGRVRGGAITCHLTIVASGVMLMKMEAKGF